MSKIRKIQEKRGWVFFWGLTWLSSCMHLPYEAQKKEEVYEFVIDSFQLKQRKQTAREPSKNRNQEEKKGAMPQARAVTVSGRGKKVVVPLSEPAAALAQVLAVAGIGPQRFSGREVLYVARKSLGQFKLYTLFWDHVQKLPMRSFLVIPSDKVYIESAPRKEVLLKIKADFADPAMEN